MTKLISKFSDGTIDVYNGDRPVKVGWQIKLPDDGGVRTGHSLDEKRARATAYGNARYNDALVHWDRPGGRTSPTRNAYFHKLAVAAGFKSWKAAYADYAEKMAAYRAKCVLEIVPLVEE